MRLDFAVLTFFIAATSSAAKEPRPKTIECPSYIVVTTNEVLAEAQTGWKVTPESKRRELDGATLFDGTPEELASLVPWKIKDSAGKSTLGWALDKQNKRDYWLECRYGFSNIKLTRQVPKESSFCVLSQAKMKGINPLDPSRKTEEIIYCY